MMTRSALKPSSIIPVEHIEHDDSDQSCGKGHVHRRHHDRPLTTVKVKART